jgi:hypothetical protein
MTGTLTPLEEQRLHELSQVVAARALDAPVHARRRLIPGRGYTRPALVLGAIGAAAAAAVLAFGGGPQAQTAKLAGFTIQRADDGVVTITLTDFRHTSQLSDQLRADGIPAVVLSVPLGQICVEPDAQMVNVKPDYSMPGGLYTIPQALPSGGGWKMRLNPAHLKPGQTMVFGLTDAADKGHGVDGSSTSVATGRLGACHFVPAPGGLNPPSPPGRHCYVNSLAPGVTSGCVIFPATAEIRFGQG